MTTLDSYLTPGRSGLPANLDALVGCLASRSRPHWGVARGPQANRSMARGAGRPGRPAVASLQLERGRIREADDQALGGLKPSDGLPPRLEPRAVEKGEPLLGQFLGSDPHAVGVRDLELDACLRHRSVRRPFRGAEAGLRSLAERPDAEAVAAVDVLAV